MSKAFSKTAALLVCVAAMCANVPAFGQQCHNDQCRMPSNCAGLAQDSCRYQQRPGTWPGSNNDRVPGEWLFDESAERGLIDREDAFGRDTYGRDVYGRAPLNDSRDGGPANGDFRYGPSFYGASSFQAPNPRDRRLQPVSYRNDVSRVRWEPDFRTGVQHSLRSRQPLLVQVSAEWCGHCVKMKRDTLVDPTVMRNLNRSFVTVMLDADKNRELVQQLKVKSLPTTLVILPNGRIVEHLNGYQSAAALQTMLNRYQQRVERETDRRLASR